MVLLAPLAALALTGSHASAQTAASDVVLVHGPLPQGWAEKDRSAEEGRLAVTLRRESDDLLTGEIDIHLMEPGVDLAGCGERIKSDIEAMGNNLYGMAPGVRYEYQFVGQPGSEEFNGYEALASRISGPLKEWQREEGSWRELGTLEMRRYCVQLDGSRVVWIQSWSGVNDSLTVEQILDSIKFRLSGNIPLCDEAWTYYGSKRLAELGFVRRESETRIQKTYRDLYADFSKAIEEYNQAHKARPAFLTSPNVGTLRVANWLSKEGGFANSRVLNEDLVFENASRAADDYVNDGKRQRGMSPPARRGTEPALYDAIVAGYNAQPADARKPLTLGQVFRLALEQRDGDAREALLLAHNTMRSLGRGRVHSGGDPEYTGVSEYKEFFNTYVETIRGDHPTNLMLRDKAGPVYHIFGTALFEIQSRGDLSLLHLLTLANEAERGLETGGPTGSRIDGMVRGFFRALTDGANMKDRSALSQLANEFEQFVRVLGEGKGGGPPDPEKFCFNVMGARLGLDLLKLLGGFKAEPIWGAGAGFEMMPNRLNAIVHVSMSPVSITWKGEKGTLKLDQDTQNLSGYYPLFLIPLYEEQKGSWGAIWFDTDRSPYSLTLDGARDGQMTLLSFDLARHQAASFVEPVRRGDRLTLDVKPGEIGTSLYRSGGGTIPPTLVSLQVVDAHHFGATGPGSGGKTTGGTGTGDAGDESGGTYPEQPFNGMQIEYRFSGVGRPSAEDSSGFTTSRRITGQLGSGLLRISGSARMGSGFGAELVVSVWAGDQRRDFKAYIKSGAPQVDSQTFDLSVQIPPGAPSGGFSIEMTGHYNVGTRGLTVSGDFSGAAIDSTSGADDSELEEARLEYEAAFSRYTTLVTEGGVGDVNKALEDYRAKYLRYKELKERLRKR